VNASAPKISVVIAAVNELVLLRNCLKALEAQAGAERIEIVVVARPAGSGAETAATIAREFPRVVIVPGEGLTIPQMRARGLERTRAPIIAVLEDHTDVVPTWLEALLRGHETDAAVVGGSVTNGCFTAVDWAAFFTEYNEHMTPMPEGTVPSLPGNNASYKRSAIEACGDLFYRGLWETFLHAALAQKGFTFRCERGAEVIHAKPFSFAHFAEQRWHLARSYAGMRVRDFPIGKRLFYAAASPLLLPLLTFRIVRRIAARPGQGYGPAFWKSLPLLLVFLSIWAVAEFVGYLAGEGDSSRKVV
jgi:GT2 family glycosyltransferase